MAIEVCPEIASGEGSVVTGRLVTRQCSDLVKVVLSNGESLTGTSPHPVWSRTRQDWVALADLAPGEELWTIPSGVRVASISRLQTVAPVYNIEVHGEHVYRVGDSGVLVHNPNNQAYQVASGVVNRALPTPQVAHPKLKNIVSDLFKGAKGPNPLGTGSTADAVRNELKTGLPTHGRFHAQKAQEYITALTKWLRNNPNESHYDRLVAQILLDDLHAALGGN